MPFDDTNPYLMDESDTWTPDNLSPLTNGEAYPAGFRRVQAENGEDPSYVYMRDGEQNFDPVGNSPIRQRMESIQQGYVQDQRGYAAPREQRGSPLRRRFEKARQFLSRPDGGQNMNMPITGR